jgi:hypothetical protein
VTTHYSHLQRPSFSQLEFAFPFYDTGELASTSESSPRLRQCRQGKRAKMEGDRLRRKDTTKGPPLRILSLGARTSQNIFTFHTSY